MQKNVTFLFLMTWFSVAIPLIAKAADDGMPPADREAIRHETREYWRDNKKKQPNLPQASQKESAGQQIPEEERAALREEMRNRHRERNQQKRYEKILSLNETDWKVWRQERMEKSKKRPKKEDEGESSSQNFSAADWEKFRHDCREKR